VPAISAVIYPSQGLFHVTLCAPSRKLEGMPKINFTGRVVPVGVPLEAQLDKLDPIQYVDNETGDKERFTVSIVGSQVDVFVELDRFTLDDVDRHRNKALDLARAALDLFNFMAGTGLILYFDKVIYPDGHPEIVVSGHPELSSLVTYNIGDIRRLYPYFAGDSCLHQALNDLINAITWPHAAQVNCARAVEGIRVMMVPGKRPAAWPKMRENLNLTEQYVLAITDISAAPRHGQRVWHPAESIQIIIERSWTIMMRYMEWKSRGEVPLSESHFKIL
jgi:hypothetical protein